MEWHWGKGATKQLGTGCRQLGRLPAVLKMQPILCASVNKAILNIPIDFYLLKGCSRNSRSLVSTAKGVWNGTSVDTGACLYILLWTILKTNISRKCQLWPTYPTLGCLWLFLLLKRSRFPTGFPTGLILQDFLHCLFMCSRSSITAATLDLCNVRGCGGTEG